MQELLPRDRPPQLPSGWTDDDHLDARLMCLVRDRDDHPAFTELLPRVARAIDGPLRRYLPLGEIDDGRAEVHLRIWSRRQLYREDRGTPRAWVSGISLHYAWDYLRKHSKAPRQLIELDSLAVPDRHSDPAAAAEDADWTAHVCGVCSEVLARFPSHVRESFELRLGGMEYAEIAAVVGRPMGTVASAVHRVRTKLLALVKDNDYLCYRPEERPMSKLNGVETPDLKAQVDELKADLAVTKARLADVEARLPAPPALAASVRNRLERLVADPAQHQSDTAWAEVEDLAEKLRPVRKQLFVKVWTRLKESRELLKKVVGHGAAIAQLRGVVGLLESVADGMTSR